MLLGLFLLVHSKGSTIALRSKNAMVVVVIVVVIVVIFGGGL